MNLKHPRFMLFLFLFGAGTFLAALHVEVHEALVLGFDAGALGFLVSCLPIWFSDNLKDIRARGARDDGGRVLL